MDWLVVILVVTALAMIGVISLIHRGRVRIWSICMILLGLGIGILLYTQINILKSWQTALYIVFSIVLALVLIYLFAVLGMRRQQKSPKADKNPEESDVLATASREPMRLSDWEAVISYSAAPPKSNNEIHRVSAEKPLEASTPVSFSSATFTPSLQADAKAEDEAVVADAITSFFRGNTQLPASAIRMDAAKSSMQPNGKAEERKPYPEPLRVSSSAKSTVEPVAEKEDDEAFESLSFRVVRDKSAQGGASAASQKKQEDVPEAAVGPKSSVTKDAPAAEQEKTVPSPVYKVHKPASSVPVEQETLVAVDATVEQDELVSPAIAAAAADVFAQAQQPEAAVISGKTPEQPAQEQETVDAFAEEMIAPVAEEPRDAAAQEMIISEAPAALAEEPQEYTGLFTAAEGLAEEPIPAAQETLLAVEEATPAEEPEMIAKEAEPVEEAEPVREDAQPVASETSGQSELPFQPEPVAEPLPALDVGKLAVPEQKDTLQVQFAAGMMTLNTLVASKEYRNAQTLIFDLLRMEYEPTDEEKRRLLLIMKLLKEKETKTNADTRSR